MTSKRREPRWVVPFLRALGRTAKVRMAAEDAGIDHSSAYVRRRTHAEFAERWAAALAEHEAAKGQAEETPTSPHPLTPPHQGEGSTGEDLAVCGDQLKRAGSERWGKKKEQAYLAALATTANHHLASKAVGMSYEGVLRRRRRDPRLETACKRAIEACRARIPEFLAGAAAATFEPDAASDETSLPKVSIDQAIKIAQLKPHSLAVEAATADESDAEAVREQLIQKLLRLRKREMPRKVAEGWLYDEVHDRLVPPGWSRASS